MVKISGLIQTVEVELPSLPGSKIVMKKGLTVGEQTEILKQFPSVYQNPQSNDGVLGAVEMLQKCIIKRNLEDDDGKVFDITADIIKKLPAPDFQFLIEQTMQEKKKQ